MKIAIVTGASSGFGRALAGQIRQVFPDIESIWLIARRADRLEDLCREIRDVDARMIPLDLEAPESLRLLQRLLEVEDPNVALLANCAGCGYLGDFDEADADEQLRMISLNVRGMTAVTRLVLPYLEYGGRILNVSSIASFAPTPRMTVYSATKAYVTAFSRGLHEELQERDISVTAVCPGPMNTEFLDVGRIYGNSRTFEALPYCDVYKTATGALLAARKHRAVYTPRFFYKLYRVLAKLLPHALVVKLTKI